MCGISAELRFSGTIDADAFGRRLDRMAHRGPDGRGVYINESGRAALGHRRLSLVDLSEQGSQPMCNEDRSIWLSCNGEIYNYRELKKELIDAGHRFSSNSDSEVIVHGYEEWGTEVLGRLKGMFAFAIWDEAKRSMFCARDRFGIKPLYYLRNNSKFALASELKSLVGDPEVEAVMDRKSMVDFLVYRYIPSPGTIYKGINKLPPAHFLQIDEAGKIETACYWEVPEGNARPSESELDERIRQLMQASVESHHIGDVPIGTFLSSGYDSSTIALFLSEIEPSTPSFSLGFHDWKESEDIYAARTAAALGIPNSSLHLGDISLALTGRMAEFYDEPLADLSCVPSYSISWLASQRVKACMSGEGADELMCGYDWYHRRELPVSHEEVVTHYADFMKVGDFNSAFLNELLMPGYREHIPEDIHWYFRHHLKTDRPVVKSIQYLDLKTFMGELVLAKMDRASMANSLEVRVPFLGEELVEFVLGLDPVCYFERGNRKQLQRLWLREKLPAEILERPKQGFVGPNEIYLNQSYYRRELVDGRLVQEGIINPEVLEVMFREWQGFRLYNLIVLQHWMNRWLP